MKDAPKGRSENAWPGFTWRRPRSEVPLGAAPASQTAAEATTP